MPASIQLWFAGYGVPDILLRAYVETGYEPYFTLARDEILAWDRYEQTAWQPRGYLWNDHATAARVRVLGEFWRLYRQRPDYSPEVGRVVLEQAARYRALLADPGRFTFATNHGVMQNLGLLELAAAFPSLPDAERSIQLAEDRLDQQLSFLITDDGVVRENSAGYQAFDLHLLAMTFRAMTLLDRPVPTAWSDRYEAGLAMLARLERPDGTLPTFGDTDAVEPATADVVTVQDGATDALRPQAPGAPDQAVTLNPAAGYWLTWDGLADWPDPSALSQTLVTWTSPPAPSHKHADELSTLVWSKGVPWLASVGYWPYDDASRADAESWSGSNAPHVANEDVASSRSASALAAGSTAGLSAIDLERRGPGGYLARRQVVRVEPDLWLIVDHVATDPGAGNQSVWQLGSDVAASSTGRPGAYQLVAADRGVDAQLTVLGSAGSEIRDVIGSRDPFAGWQVEDSIPKPAPAITVDQPPGDAWTAVVLDLSPSGAATGTATMSDASSADAWTVTVPTAAGTTTVTWAHDSVMTEERVGESSTTANLKLDKVADATPQNDATRAAFEGVAAAYPSFQERTSARTKVTLALGILVLAQIGVLMALWRWRPALLRPLSVVSAIGWLGLAAALVFVVLPSWQVVPPV